MATATFHASCHTHLLLPRLYSEGRYYLQKLQKGTEEETKIYRLLDLELVCNNRCTTNTSNIF